MNIKNFMFKLLPIYYHKNDSYKVNGRGILERFLDTLDDELQENTVDKLESLINQLDPYTATDEYLSLLAYTVGNPLDITGYEDVYRDQISQAINLYKYKGTKKGYSILFAILGYSVGLSVIIPLYYNYDSGVLFDNNARYDFTKCNTHCLSYDLIYSNIEGITYEGLTIDQENLLKKFIREDFEPINVKLRNLQFVQQGSNRIFTREYSRNFN